MKRALGLVLAGLLIPFGVMAHEDDQPVITCTMIVSDFTEGDIFESIGIPREPDEDYLAEYPDVLEEARARWGWLPFMDDPERNGRPAPELCDSWLFLPGRLVP